MINALFRFGAICLFGAVTFAQTVPVVLDIEVENAVRYIGDVTDPSKLAVNTAATPAGSTRAFTDTIYIGDIVAINGKPAKGLWTSRQYTMGFSPSPAPGSAIADVTQGTIAECKYEILNASGAFVGRLMDGGLAPHAVSGGTGAFIGAKGEQASTTARVVKAVRVASMSEDPANRRSNGGGNIRILLRLIPAARPEVVLTANGPAVVHGDGKLVSNTNPAQAGEVLTLYGTGLGPDHPGRGLRPAISPRHGVRRECSGRGINKRTTGGGPLRRRIPRCDRRISSQLPRSRQVSIRVLSACN